MMTPKAIHENIDGFDNLFKAVTMTKELIDSGVLSEESKKKLLDNDLDSSDFYEMGIYFLGCSNAFRKVLGMSKHPETDSYFRGKTTVQKSEKYLKGKGVIL